MNELAIDQGYSRLARFTWNLRLFFTSVPSDFTQRFFFLQTKVVPSRSNSTQSFDEALRESEALRRASAAPTATSPTIPEDKLLS